MAGIQVTVGGGVPWTTWLVSVLFRYLDYLLEGGGECGGVLVLERREACTNNTKSRIEIRERHLNNHDRLGFNSRTSANALLTFFWLFQHLQNFSALSEKLALSDYGGLSVVELSVEIFKAIIITEECVLTELEKHRAMAVCSNHRWMEQQQNSHSHSLSHHHPTNQRNGNSNLASLLEEVQVGGGGGTIQPGIDTTLTHSLSGSLSLRQVVSAAVLIFGP